MEPTQQAQFLKVFRLTSYAILTALIGVIFTALMLFVGLLTNL